MASDGRFVHLQHLLAIHSVVKVSLYNVIDNMKSPTAQASYPDYKHRCASDNCSLC